MYACLSLHEIAAASNRNMGNFFMSDSVVFTNIAKI